MKRVGTQKFVIDTWCEQTQDYARSKSIFFERDTIYSYGKHFPIARWWKYQTVLFTTQDYSVTTAKHKSLVRRKIHGNIIKVNDPSAEPCDDTLTELQERLDEQYATFQRA